MEQYGKVKITQKISLIFLVPSLQFGGAERVAVRLLPHLAENFNLVLTTLEDRFLYHFPQEIKKVSFSPPLNNPYSHIIRIPYHVFRLSRLVITTRAQIVLSFMEQANIINIMSSFFKNHRAIISQRTMPQQQYGHKGWMGRLILFASMCCYPKASHIVAISKEIMRYLISEYKVSPEKVSFIPNPVDLKELEREMVRPLPKGVKKPFLLHVGRLNMAQKGQDILLKAFAKLIQKWPELHLVLVGDGPDKEKILRLIKFLGIEGRVYLAGWQQNVAAFMANAEMLLFPSRYEGWPNVLLEAMACRCPVVAADCLSGPREIIGNNRYGVLVPVDSVEALANTASRLLSRSDLVEHLREVGHKRAREFSVERIASRYEEVIRSAAH